jgi:hypothetical protein
MTTEAKPESVIADWIATISRDGGVERYDHLHIDQIDSRWAAREDWVRGGLEAFRIALPLRGQLGVNPTVALAFSLESDERLRGVDFVSLDEFKTQLNWSPPSLYLFRRGCEPWTEIEGEPVLLDSVRLFEVRLEATVCYYIEFKQPDSSE